MDDKKVRLTLSDVISIGILIGFLTKSAGYLIRAIKMK